LYPYRCLRPQIRHPPSQHTSSHTHTLPPSLPLLPYYLQEWAGHDIENIAIVGSSLHEGWTKSIPQEYAELDKTVMPTTIIMDGGGNDVSKGGRKGGRRIVFLLGSFCFKERTKKRKREERKT